MVPSLPAASMAMEDDQQGVLVGGVKPLLQVAQLGDAALQPVGVLGLRAVKRGNVRGMILELELARSGLLEALSRALGGFQFGHG